ncbi:hypothetical protein AR689_18995 [Arthrobacter sp. EpRS71]|nr:hypothetical protein AR689_18995 [Arthrobacter sp. EpRS71]
MESGGFIESFVVFDRHQEIDRGRAYSATPSTRYRYRVGVHLFAPPTIPTSFGVPQWRHGVISGNDEKFNTVADSAQHLREGGNLDISIPTEDLGYSTFTHIKSFC